MPLTEILDPTLGSFLSSPPEFSGRYRTPKELEDLVLSWGSRGAEVVKLGVSKEGRPIRCAVFGTGPRTLLAWGYPHPDEPIGAEALCWLGESLLAGAVPGLDGWRVVLVLCADPDEASRQLWLDGPRTMEGFATGVWRPMKLDWMVDYGFPLDWGPFWQPADFDGQCRLRRDCQADCGDGGCRFAGRPPGPLPESVALADAIDRFRPEVVAAMHSTHTGGDYTFLLERETPEVLADLTAIPAVAGTGRHLGEALDRGRRWRRDSPDLIREQDLHSFARRVQSAPWYDPELVYQMNHSAACYIQAQGTGGQFICPETTLFRHPDFSNSSLSLKEEVVRVAVEDRPHGRYRVTRLRHGHAWVIAHQERVDDSEPLTDPEESVVPATRGMLGVRALLGRREALAVADGIWARCQLLPDPVWHPYVEERARMRAPARFVHDRSMLIFRVRPDYRQRATVAQAATFAFQWPAQTASLVGNMLTWLDAQEDSAEVLGLRQDAHALIGSQLALVPAEMQTEAPLAPAMISMLARVLRVVQARGL